MAVKLGWLLPAQQPSGDHQGTRERKRLWAVSCTVNREVFRQHSLGTRHRLPAAPACYRTAPVFFVARETCICRSSPRFLRGICLSASSSGGHSITIIGRVAVKVGLAAEYRPRPLPPRRLAGQASSPPSQCSSRAPLFAPLSLCGMMILMVAHNIHVP